MKVLDDYTCTECGLTEERLARIGEPVACSSCGEATDRQVSTRMNFTLESVSGDFPTATRNWERDYTKRARKAQEHGE